ncbi:MAG: universal stress protein [Deltaproteobacteria bacterium]|nr:universal stress protein [Deltaproteobacteria bacterium]
MDDVLKRNALSALQQILDLRRDESFLIVTDQATMDVGVTFRAAAEEIGARPAFYVLPEVSRPLADIPEGLMALIPDADVAVTCFSGRPAETPFRISLIRALTRVVRRLGHGPGITTDMLRSGPMSVDYVQMAVKAHELIRRFEGAARIRVTAPGGTDLTLGVEDRPFQTDADIPDGRWGNLPAGEVWCAPVEDAADGVLVCDGSVGDLGQVPAPLRIVVEKGRILDVQCADPGFLDRVKQVLSVDDSARVIGELGMGLNPGARLTGNLLEDEKAARTAHVAFGNNEDMGGGHNRSRTHRDFLFRDPTFEVTFADGRTEVVIAAGETAAPPPPEPRKGYAHVMVCLDFSAASVSALRVGDELARMSGARLSLCHVVNHPTPVSPLCPHYANLPDPALARREEEESIERLDALAADVALRGVDEYEAVVLKGPPELEIVRWAEEHEVDMIVLASTGVSRIESLLLGSVAEGVARTAKCRVLLAR